MFLRAVGDNDTVRTVLDEAHPDHDIERDSYLALQRRIISAEDRQGCDQQVYSGN